MHSAVCRGGFIPFVALLGALLLSGCATPKGLLERSSAQGPQWSEQPLGVQVEWVKSVATPEDAGIAKTFWRRALEVVTGKEKNFIVKPYGVLYDEAARLVVADPGAGVVHLMETKENRYTRITGENGALFVSPIGVAEDAANRLYITDSAANTVYCYDLATGRLTPFMTQLERPTGIAYNKVNKLLYISETTAHRVIAVNEKGEVKLSLGDRSDAGTFPLHLPTDIAIDGKGTVYVNDPLNYKIKSYFPDGRPAGRFGAMGDGSGELNKPKGLGVDADGHIYVVDAMLDAVQVFNGRGEFLFLFGRNGVKDGEFWMPSGISVRGEHVFVADTYNQRVQVFRIVTSDAEPAADGTEKEKVK